MTIEQALFGELNRGHGLLMTSGDRNLMAELAPRLDLPDNAPPGADWSPFVSGFPFKGWYVVARTFHDQAAPRAGMVLAHAVLIPLEKAGTCSDLRPLFKNLIAEGNRPSELPEIAEVEEYGPPPLSSELEGVVSALVSPGKGPVVRFGHLGFEELISALWVRLWPEMRKSFSFRLSFGPNDIVETPAPNLVCTPRSLVARWRHVRISEQYLGAPQSAAADALLNDGAGRPLLAFGNSIGVTPSSFEELSLLERAYRFSELKPAGMSSALTATRLVAALSPQRDLGGERKKALINNLALSIESAGMSDLLKLRNLDLTAYEGLGEIWRSLSARIDRSDFDQREDHDTLDLVRDALSTEAIKEWRDAVLRGLRTAAEKGSRSLATALWRWIAMGESDDLLQHIEIGKNLENAMVAVAPAKLPVASAMQLLEIAAAKNLHRLHASAAIAALGIEKAAGLQARVEPSNSSIGLRLIGEAATDEQKVDIAVEVGDDRLVEIAADAVSRHPALMQRVTGSRTVVRDIWYAAIGINPAAWKGPLKPEEEFRRQLVALLEGDRGAAPIVNVLSKTPLANIIDFDRRSELWSVLAEPARQRILTATAQGYFMQVEDGRELWTPEQPLLAAVLQSPKLDALLDKAAADDFHRGLELISITGAFNEQQFQRWLSLALAKHLRLSEEDASKLGHLVARRRWSQVANDLLKLLSTGKREDVRPALRNASDLIGFVDRWYYKLAPVSAYEKWESIADLASELYPPGPDHDDLWERAGGRGADLTQFGNGRSRWREALRKVRYGRQPTIRRLLVEMLKDYPKNEHLRLLAIDPEFQ